VASSTPLRASSILQDLLFLLLWNLANTLPWLATGIVYHYLPIGALAWLFACLFVGIAQWFVLQRYIDGLEQWVFATLIGGLLGFIGFATVILAALIVPLGTGFAVGVAQWSVLRHKIKGAFWWVVATSIGALLGLGLGYILPSFVNFSDSGSIELTVFNVGIYIEMVSSVVTGCTMLWLLKRDINRKR